jgi:hypothetical protein
MSYSMADFVHKKGAKTLVSAPFSLLYRFTGSNSHAR